MNPKAKEILFIFVLLIIAAYFLFNGLVLAKPFLAPLALAVLLTMVMVPFSNKLERWGFKRGWSAFISVIILFLSFMGIFLLVAIEVNNISQDWPKIQKSLKPKLEEIQKYIHEKTGISPSDQETMVQDVVPGSSGNAERQTTSSGADTNSKEQEEGNQNQEATGAEDTEEKKSNTEDNAGQNNVSGNQKIFSSLGTGILNFFTFLGTSLLTLIYIFFFLLYRNKIKNSILKFTKPEKRNKTKEVLLNSIKLSQSYLLGRLLLILFLAIIYSIGLSISGVQHAIVVSIIAALLSLIPYIGNIIGFILAMAMGAFSGGDLMTFIGIAITFSIAQFIESYILEPYIVGHKVEINPYVTIIVVVLGGAVWGVMGMIISIPIFGILKIVSDHIPALNPIGYALGEEDISSQDEENIFEKMIKKVKGR